MDELDSRKTAVLRAVVEEYIATAQPVGSERVARGRALGVSSATIRNDMAVLERDGFITQPHTSAGRIPTDKGYRYFVDHLDRIGTLAAPHRQAVTSFFAQAHHALEDILHETSHLLARITDQAAVVIGPQHDTATIRSLQLVSLQPNVVLAVAVLSDGAVEKAVVRLERDVDDVRVGSASAALHGRATGSTLAGLPSEVTTGDAETDTVIAAAVEALRSVVADPGEPVYVGGTSNIAAEHDDFTANDSVSRLLQLLEQQYLVVTLVHSLIDRGVTVRIGSENEWIELKECSVVLAPVTVEGDVAGTVGILGPTRMDYAQALAAVPTVSQRLGRHLTS